MSDYTATDPVIDIHVASTDPAEIERCVMEALDAATRRGLSFRVNPPVEVIVDPPATFAGLR